MVTSRITEGENHYVTIMVINVCFSSALNFNTASVYISVCSELNWVT